MRLYSERVKEGAWEEISQGAAVVAVGDATPLRLHFDVMGKKYIPLEAYIIACDGQWKRAIFGNTAALSRSYFLHNTYYSTDNITPYVHYDFTLPRIQEAGNYVIIVHQQGEKDKRFVSGRFVVHQSKALIHAEIAAALQVKNRQQKHRILLKIDLNAFSGLHPYSDVRVVVRQNRHWRTTTHWTRPHRVIQGATLVYEPLQEGFCARLPFRRLDLRRRLFLQPNMERYIQTDSTLQVVLKPDKALRHTFSSFAPDWDGQYFFAGESLASPHAARYIEVHVSLQAPPSSSPWYMIGGFNQWMHNIPLHYDEKKKHWHTKVLLKQGYYEYRYENAHGQALSGCHRQSNNTYEVFVYVRDRFQAREVPVGYTLFRGAL